MLLRCEHAQCQRHKADYLRSALLEKSITFVAGFCCEQGLLGEGAAVQKR